MNIAMVADRTGNQVPCQLGFPHSLGSPASPR